MSVEPNWLVCRRPVQYLPLFTSIDGSPIKVRFDITTKGASPTKDAVQIYLRWGGSVANRYEEDSSVISLSDKTQKHLKSEFPVFRVDWMFKCIDALELLNINTFLINKSKFVGRDFMNVIYEKIETALGSVLYFNDSTRHKDVEKKPNKRRRGAPPKKGYVSCEVDNQLSADDFFSEVAHESVVHEIELIMLNEGTRNAVDAQLSAPCGKSDDLSYNQSIVSSDNRICVGGSNVFANSCSSKKSQSNWGQILLISTKPKKRVRKDLEQKF